MNVNGIELGDLVHEVQAPQPPVPNRVLHIDGDVLAYQCASTKPGVDKTLDDARQQMHEIIAKLKSAALAEHVQVHTTPSGSTKGLRYMQAIQKEYQGNRKNKVKPELMPQVQAVMRNLPECYEWYDCEADDGMTSAQHAAEYSETSVICSTDKDLMSVPGWHLNWDTLELQNVSHFGELHYKEHTKAKSLAGSGRIWFWAQMLMGDQVDNIQGLPTYRGKKVGQAGALSILEGIRTEADAARRVAECYRETGEATGYRHWKTGETVDWQRVFLSEGMLLWMRRDTTAGDFMKYLKETLG